MTASKQGINQRLETTLTGIFIDDAGMQAIFDESGKQLRRGLVMHEANPDSFDLRKSDFMMLDSGVGKTPTGQERGTFYGLDMGGSNVRAVRVELNGNRTIEKVSERSMSLLEVPYARHLRRGVLDKHATATELFDGVIYAIKQLMQEHDEAAIRTPLDSSPLPVGLTCSFGINQRGLNSAILTQWSKEIETGTAVSDPAEEVVGKDFLALANAAFQRHYIHAVMNCILNDTVSTLIIGGFVPSKQVGVEPYPCNVGVVIGSGFNICYYEPEAKLYRYQGKVVNVECGGLKSSFPRVAADAIVDFESTNPGHQVAEKAISGLYLGEVVRLMLIDILQDEAPKALWRKGLVKTENVAAIFNADASECEALMTSWLDCGNNSGLASIVKAVCDAVFLRSARLAASIMAAIIAETRHATIQGQAGVRVGVDGAVYVKNAKYQEEVHRVVHKLLGSELTVDFNVVVGGSCIGAALLAACTAE